MSNVNEIASVRPSLGTSWTRETERPTGIGSLFSIQNLKQAAMSIAEARRGKTFPTRDLVGLLTTHAARNRRMVQPRAHLRMTLPLNINKVAVKLTFES